MFAPGGPIIVGQVPIIPQVPIIAQSLMSQQQAIPQRPPDYMSDEKLQEKGMIYCIQQY